MLPRIVFLLGFFASGRCLTCHYYDFINRGGKPAEVVKDQVVNCTTADAKFCFTATADGYDKESGEEVKTVLKGCNNDPKYGTFPAFDGDYFKDCQKSGHQSKNPKGATADAYCCDSNECNSAAVTPRPIPPTPPTTTPKSSSRTSAGFAIGAVVVTAVTAVLAK